MIICKDTLTYEQVKERLKYDPVTGIFTWAINYRGRVKQGCNAGYTKKSGRTRYLIIGLYGKKYFAHRLAFLYMEGLMPYSEIDHIDHNGLNNKWNNIRRVSRTYNTRNQRLSVRNKSGYIGVSWDKKAKKWTASIMVNGKTVNLGSYDNKEHAALIRKRADEHFFFHENHGKKDEISTNIYNTTT